jgi:hypothetical protein
MVPFEMLSLTESAGWREWQEVRVTVLVVAATLQKATDLSLVRAVRPIDTAFTWSIVLLD